MSARVLIEQGDDTGRVTAAVAALVRMGTPVTVHSEGADALVRVTPAPCGCCCAVLIEGDTEGPTGIVPATFIAADPWEDDLELLDGTPATPSSLLAVRTAAAAAVRWLVGLPLGAAVRQL